MGNRLRIVLLIGILLGLGLLLVFWQGTPRLLEVIPGENAQGVPAGTEVRLTFSRPLQIQAVENLLSFEPATSGSFRWEDRTLIFTPDRPWSAGSTVQVKLAPGAPTNGFPSLRLRQGKEWSFKIRALSLLYLSPAAGPANLYLLDLSTGETTPVTDLPDGILDYVVSPDGAVLYYSARVAPESSEIVRMALTAGGGVSVTPDDDIEQPVAPEPVVLLECPRIICEELALDPQGKYLAFERSGLPGGDIPEKPQVWILPLSAAVADPPFLAGDPTHQTVQPSWSNQGLLAFYDSDELAYLFVEPGQGQKARFPNQTGQPGAWLPDGTAFLAAEIFYLDENISPELATLNKLADSRLMLFDLASGRSETLTPGEGVEDAVPVFSPDGTFLAFARKYLDVQRWSPGRQIWIATVPGREARQMTAAPLYNHFDFAWSPSGDQIAYVRFNQSTMNEPPEIWVLDLISGISTRYVPEGYQPQWIP